MRWLSLLLALLSAPVLATPPCWTESRTLNLPVPDSRAETIPRNSRVFLSSDEDPAQTRLSVSGAALETDVTNHGTHFEMVPRDLLAAGVSLTIERPDYEYALRVSDEIDAQRPPAPVVVSQRPDYQCRPIVVVEIEEPADTVVLLSRAGAAPTPQEPADAAVVVSNDTLVVQSEDGSDLTLFLVAVDLAGHRSAATRVELDFRNAIGCSSGAIASEPMLCALFVGLLLARRRPSPQGMRSLHGHGPP